MSHPGVGALTALAFVLILGQADRFECGKQVASYLGLVPLEKSSGKRRRLGHITKQGHSVLRFLRVAAAQATTRKNPEWHSKYFHLAPRRGKPGRKINIFQCTTVVPDMFEESESLAKVQRWLEIADTVLL